MIHASKTTIKTIAVVVLWGIVEAHVEAWRLTEGKAAGRVLVPTQIIQVNEATCEYVVSRLGSLLEGPKRIRCWLVLLGLLAESTSRTAECGLLITLLLGC